MKTKVTEASLLILIFTNVSFTSANLPSSPPMPSNTNTNSKPNKSSQSTYSSSQKLAPCQSCRTLVKSFLLGMERTAKGHYGGGDTAWEEENKKIYKNSELRLVEIQEGLCSEVTTGKDQCHTLAVENEDLIEEWWHKYRNAGEDLQSWLCVSKLSVCCPDLHYGPDCLPCTGFPDNVCSGHGKCKGAGTRKGNGECNCDIAYAGKLCDTCAKDHFEAYKDDEKLVCSPCHKSCEGGCIGAGPIKCNTCKEGWENDEERGCIDLNECLLLEKPCKKNEFCVNSEGTHMCMKCDESCDGCFGDGPDMCERCKVGYVFRDKICIDDSTAQRSVHLNITRYFTYLGLCIATCIIFQKNMAIASGVGIAVAVYISASEYLLSTQLL